MWVIDEHRQIREKTSTTVQTTLYDLLGAIQATIRMENEEAVIEKVMHLFRKGRIRFLRDVSCLN